MFEGIDLISNPAMSQDQAVTENAETAMDMETTSDEDGAAVCAVLEYKLQKKTRKVRKLKRELEKDRAHLLVYARVWCLSLILFHL